MGKFYHIKMNDDIQYRLSRFLREQVATKCQPYSELSELKARIDAGFQKLIAEAMPANDASALEKHSCMHDTDHIVYCLGSGKHGAHTERSFRWGMKCRRPAYLPILNVAKSPVGRLIREYNELDYKIKDEVSALSGPYIGLIYDAPTLQDVVD